ncbi:hypothetical protein GASC598B02_008910 [Gilliamella apicola SCGC AB-598-B02]|nr:hypothetical protein GASC598B02_008910 [Gilliamella apicola SCGC AB-598-B02]
MRNSTKFILYLIIRLFLHNNCMLIFIEYVYLWVIPNRKSTMCLYSNHSTKNKTFYNYNSSNANQLDIAYVIVKNFFLICAVSIFYILISSTNLEFSFHIFTNHLLYPLDIICIIYIIRIISNELDFICNSIHFIFNWLVNFLQQQYSYFY